MSLSVREMWALIHGILAGGLFLLLFTGGLVALMNLRGRRFTPEGLEFQVRVLRFWTLGMAIVAWATVIFGAYVVYPWYRAKAPPGADLADYPQVALMADASKAGWHNFGMEWKEHVAWFAPILATTLAYLVAKYRSDLTRRENLRRFCVFLLTASFLCATTAGLLGALINKAAPIK